MTQRYHHHSSVVQDIIAPTTSIREIEKRKGVEPKDFMSENKQQIRSTQEELREQQIEQEEQAARPAFKMQQFENAPSKIQDKIEALKPSETHEFLRKNQQISQVKVPKPESRSDSAASSESSQRGVRQAVPSEEPKIPKEQRNYIKENAKAAKIPPPKEAEPNKTARPLGEVPEYLKERQNEAQRLKDEEQREEEERKRLAKIPKGCRGVGDDERQALLKDLKEALTFENKRFNSFKFVADNQSAIKARQECLDKIEQLEKTIHDFERPGPLYLALE